MSCPSKDRHNTGPAVSRFRTISTTVPPEKNQTSSQPTVLMMGLMAMRTG